MGEVSIDDLYFGVKKYNVRAHDELETFNLFSHGGVKRSVALYVKDPSITDSPLSFCFGDVRHRSEDEMQIFPHHSPEKVRTYDIYFMYVEPNEKLLMEMVNSVSKASAEKYLKEN